MVELKVKQLLTVLSFVSKTLEINERDGEGMTIVHPAEIQHWNIMKDDMRQILKSFDREYPSLLPLPNDGVSWSERD